MLVLLVPSALKGGLSARRTVSIVSAGNVHFQGYRVGIADRISKGRDVTEMHRVRYMHCVMPRGTRTSRSIQAYA